MQVIIYKNNDGGVAIVYPTSELSIEEIVTKDVPPIAKQVGTGEFVKDDDGNEYEITRQVIEPRPYEVIDITELPLDGTLNEMGVPNIDKTFRNAWEWAE